MLFRPVRIAGLHIQNRFVRSATHEWLAEEDGTPTRAIDDLYETLAQQGIDAREKEAYFKDYARLIKEAVDVPVILVGGLRSKAVMEQMITDGYADMVSLSRPLIREPDLVVKFRDRGVEKAQCVSCNECFDESGVKCNFE